MLKNGSPAAAFKDTKPHYHLLDGLRGVAAVTVVCYHVFEAFATSHLDQVINHGYLAVDFFFLLSGFVMGYAYDDRWNGMTTGEFFRRRLVRLHPMVIMGAFIGAVLFYTQDCPITPVSQVAFGTLLVALLLNLFMIPVTLGMDVRGFGEMYPLNGPNWSLFFEYIGNILYALLLRRLATRVLAVVTFCAACMLAAFAITGRLGDLGAGFSMNGYDVLGGSLRLLFSYSAGLLMARVFRPSPVKGAFWKGALVVVAVAAIPRIGDGGSLWMNGVYDTLCCILLFPLVVWMAASGTTTDKLSTRLCTFLGDISYPLYMVHYPLIYVYYAWVKNNNYTFSQSLPGAVALVACSLVLAWLCLKFYDLPLRRWLTRRFMGHERKD
ncbi:MAG: acyltransferase family protein [Prevotella sp.]